MVADWLGVDAVPADGGALEVDRRRARPLNSVTARSGPVVYWMQRDQRAADNWALLHAAGLAEERRVPLAVVFNVVPDFLLAGFRQYAFMLRGLERTAEELAALRIPFFLVSGEPADTVHAFARDNAVGCVVTDFNPLRLPVRWRTEVARRLGEDGIACEEVDAHNIVPAWVASQKQEYGARTLRPKLRRLAPDFLTGFPELVRLDDARRWPGKAPVIDWRAMRADLGCDRSFAEVDWLEPGSAAGLAALERFVGEGLERFGDRSDPNAGAESDLSPYLHFGQVAPQRAALAAIAAAADAGAGASAVDDFLEQLIVRRELADNYCLYNPAYDSVGGFPDWARRTLDEHRNDPRQHRYSEARFEAADTHDPLWNAAQLEMARRGKMHNYMRMYWAKKILEWTPSPEIALEIAQRLNDKLELDGRDPNGFTGVAWSIGGVHDRAWQERPVFGKIRYMSAAGCKRKFDVDAYVRRWAEGGTRQM